MGKLSKGHDRVTASSADDRMRSDRAKARHLPSASRSPDWRSIRDLACLMHEARKVNSHGGEYCGAEA
jgi:hypothetical protein